MRAQSKLIPSASTATKAARDQITHGQVMLGSKEGIDFQTKTKAVKTGFF